MWSGRDVGTSMFIAAQCTIAKRWKQHECPPTDGQIHRLQYTHVMEYYATLKRKEILSQATTRIDLEYVIIHEIIESQKD